MKRWLMVYGVIAITMSSGALAYGAAAAKMQFWNATDLKFKESAKGIERAVVWGDPDKGEYGAIIKYQAGAERGWHAHSNPLHLTMISGTLTFVTEGSEPQDLGPGSGVTEAANVKHSARCKEGADCLFLITGTKKYDFKPVKETTAKK